VAEALAKAAGDSTKSVEGATPERRAAFLVGAGGKGMCEGAPKVHNFSEKPSKSEKAAGKPKRLL